MTNWLLPQHLHDIIAPQSHAIEERRRALLDLYMSWGYGLIIPPIEEFQESLLQSKKTNNNFDKRMLKVVDNLSGKMMGLRTDITPQSARIDAHILQGKGVARLCYGDKVLHSYPRETFASREPISMGAEIYGIKHWQADVEAIHLLDKSLSLCGINNHNIELHHMGLIRDLANFISQKIGKPIDYNQWLEALQTKSRSQILKLIVGADSETTNMILAFLDLYGDVSILEHAATILPKHEKISAHLQEINNIVKALKTASPKINLSIDLSDGRGYSYHSGLIFAAYAPKWANSLANGGRYDGFGNRYSNEPQNRPATGFTLDLTATYSCYCVGHNQAQEGTNLSGTFEPIYTRRIFAPSQIWLDKNGKQYIENLRAQKIAVIIATEKDNPDDHKCSEIITKTKNGFNIIKI